MYVIVIFLSKKKTLLRLSFTSDLSTHTHKVAFQSFELEQTSLFAPFSSVNAELSPVGPLQ